MMTSSQDLLFHCAEKGTQPVGPRPVESMATIAGICYLRVKVVQNGHIANMIETRNAVHGRALGRLLVDCRVASSRRPVLTLVGVF
jgi:hypothetical protein